MSYKIQDLIYQGEKGGVRNWSTIGGASFYWHPDWLHIAEEATGISATANIECTKEKATENEAAETIVKHLNAKE